MLNANGLFVLSIDKNQNEYIDMGNRKIKIYPDDPMEIQNYLSKSNMKLIDQFETAYAYVIVSRIHRSLA